MCDCVCRLVQRNRTKEGAERAQMSSECAVKVHGCECVLGVSLRRMEMSH